MESPSPPLVDIHYRRLPDDERVFTQQLLLDRPDVKVTLARGVDFESPVIIDGEVALESGSDAVWFTFPGQWHDIGRFHRRDGTFTGIYANVLTPPVFVQEHREDRNSREARNSREDRDDRVDGEDPVDRGDREIWRTTDLFLDVWLPRDGGFLVLDRDQLEEALRKGWLSRRDADRALEEVVRIQDAHAEGRWPPPVVEAWTLERARLEAGAPPDAG